MLFSWPKISTVPPTSGFTWSKSCSPFHASVRVLGVESASSAWLSPNEVKEEAERTKFREWAETLECEQSDPRQNLTTGKMGEGTLLWWQEPGRHIATLSIDASISRAATSAAGGRIFHVICFFASLAGTSDWLTVGHVPAACLPGLRGRWHPALVGFGGAGSRVYAAPMGGTLRGSGFRHSVVKRKNTLYLCNLDPVSSF